MLLSRTMRLTTTALVSAGLLFSSVPALANPACQAGVMGCVLPVRDAVQPAAPAPVDTAPPVAEEVGGRGMNWLLPALAALAAAVVAYLLLHDNDDDELPDSPG